MGNSFYRWPTADDITLFLQLVDPTGVGSTGKTPEVSIRRVRETHGAALDSYFWNGAGFQSGPFWLPMTEADAVNTPGLYLYEFEQSLVGEEWVYLVYFRHTAAPLGFAIEEHVLTSELFIPSNSPVTIPDPNSIMGKLVAMEDPTKPVALANADAVWDEILAGHLLAGSTGEALAQLAMATTGAYQIEITVTDDTPIPLQGAQIDIFDNTNTFFLSRVYSDVIGKVNVALDAGAYALRIFKSGFAFTVPEPLVVAADGAVTFVGTSLIIVVPPSNPNLCAIFGTIRDASGQPVANARVVAYAIVPQVAQGTQQHDQETCTVTDGDGFFRLELERLTQVNFSIEETGLDVARTVPDAATQDVTTWT